MGLSFRAFEGTDADYQLLVEMVNAENDGRRTVEDLRLEDREWNPDLFRLREFVMFGESCIGEATCRERPIPPGASAFGVGLNLLPAFGDRGFEQDIFERQLALAESKSAKTVTTGATDDQAGRIHVLERLGFRLVGRHVESRCDLLEFEAARFETATRRVEEQKITIRSIAEFEAAGVDWLPRLYAVEDEVLRELQIKDRPTLDEFRMRTARPRFWFPNAHVVAIDGERWVGLSSLCPAPGNPELAWTGFTCVLASHRRRGIATALKVAALERAKQLGIKWVQAANEEDNQMLQLNYRLGFQKVLAGRTYRKVLQQ